MPVKSHKGHTFYGYKSHMDHGTQRNGMVTLRLLLTRRLALLATVKRPCDAWQTIRFQLDGVPMSG